MLDPFTSDFPNWAARLLEEYSNSAIPAVYVANPMEWRSWASTVAALAIFADLGAPSPDGFSDWREWAAALMLVVNPGV